MGKIERLIEQLNNNNYFQVAEVVAAAAKADEITDELILQILKDESREFVIANLIRVVGLRGEASDDLSELIHNYARTYNSNIVREQCFKALEKIGDFSTLSMTIEMLQTEKNNAVREAMLHVLGNLSTRDSIKTLVDNLTHEDSFVREAAAEAIFSMHTEPIKTLIMYLKEASSTSQKVEIIEVLRMTKSREAKTILTEMLNHSDRSVKHAARFALDEIG